MTRQSTRHLTSNRKSANGKTAVAAALATLSLIAAGCGNVAPEAASTDVEVQRAAVTGCSYNFQLANPTAAWTITAPKVEFVYWGAYWQSGSGAAARTASDARWTPVMNAPGFWGRLKEYGIDGGRWLGSAAITTSLPASGTVTEAQIQAELQSELQAGLLPASDRNTFYVLMLPPGISDQYDINAGANAHHGVTTATAQVPASAYGVIPNASASDNVTSHEIIEGVTDPDTTTGWRDPSSGEELGDLCVAGYQVGIAGGGMQYVFSQKDCACVARHEPSSPDYNGDWKADLAVMGTSAGLTSSQIGVALSAGSGTFGATKISSTDFAGYATTAGAKVLPGDFDGDGYTDLAAVGVGAWNGIKIAYSKGDGTFGSTVSVSTTFGATAATAGVKVIASDVNGDGMADLIATGAPGSTTVTVAFAGAGTTFRVTNLASSLASTAALSGAKLTTGDINNDGREDLVVAGTSTSTITVGISNGDGSYVVTTPSTTVASAAAASGAKVFMGDIDNDNSDDLIINGATTVTVAHSNGDGTFTAKAVEGGSIGNFPSLAAQSGAVLATGDFDGDRHMDLVATGVSSWTTLPVLLMPQATNDSWGYQFSFVNSTANFAGYAGGAGNQVAGAVGYATGGGGCTSNCVVQINAGGPTASPYVADQSYSGGSTIVHANSIDVSGVTNPAPTAVYQTGRVGNFTYTLTGFTAGSSHTVRLHFAETYFNTAGARTFNVAINGTQVLTNYDIFKAAGAQNKAVAPSFTATATSAGQIAIQFTTVVNNSLVSGVEVH